MRTIQWGHLYFSIDALSPWHTLNLQNSIYASIATHLIAQEASSIMAAKPKAPSSWNCDCFSWVTGEGKKNAEATTIHGAYGSKLLTTPFTKMDDWLEWYGMIDINKSAVPFFLKLYFWTMKEGWQFDVVSNVKHIKPVSWLNRAHW